MTNDIINYLSGDDVKFQISNLKQLTFEITDACNLKCTYCGYGELYEDYDKREGKFLSIEKAIKLIDYLVKYWNSNYNISAIRKVVISFYGGEPLLNMSFIKTIVEYLSKLHCPNRKFNFSMTTNAMLLDKYMDYLVKHDFSLLISLDGNEKNNGYRITQKELSSFDTIISNVEKLKTKYPDYFSKRINFNAVLHNRNSIEEIHKFFKDNYDKVPSVGELNNMGVRPEMQEKFMQTYKNTYESLYQSENYEEIEEDMILKSGTYKSLILFIHHHSGFVYSDYNELIYGINSTRKIPTGTCLPFQRKMYITVNGKILPCERIGHQFSLGQVTSNGVELDFDYIARKYNNYFSKVDKQCNKCIIKNSCVQCVFNLKNLDKVPICYGFMNERRFEEYKSQQMSILQKNPDIYYKIMNEIIYDN